MGYDGLVIATGGRGPLAGHTPDQDEWVLRSHTKSTLLRSDVATAPSVLIVGGGFLGMEIAFTCRKLGNNVTVVDLAHR